MVGVESLGRQDRIRKRADFQRCYRQGGRIHGDLATLHVMPSSEGRCRLGITATRKVGPAVVRQKLRRRTREIFRRWPGRRELPVADIVIHLKPASASASFAELESQLRGQLRRLQEKAARSPSDCGRAPREWR